MRPVGNGSVRRMSDEQVNNRSRKQDARLLAARIAGVAARTSGPPSEISVASPTSRALRVPAFKSATVQLITGERLDVILKNISATGARVEFMRDIQLSDRVYLREPTLQLSVWAYVVWQERGVAGLEFVPDLSA